ncbi:hypothetical protein [Streptomyces sp. SID3343]|uniref:hypothetical protein n=1 Tax=Streptomyces sp. SID3343 TaxID=2690260 RepID=UPI00136ED510|nr:hypothetical protein [Streptomyces sp. SID3343]
MTRRRLGTGPTPPPSAAPNAGDDVARLTIAARAATTPRGTGDAGTEHRRARRSLGRGGAGAGDDGEAGG